MNLVKLLEASYDGEEFMKELMKIHQHINSKTNRLTSLRYFMKEMDKIAEKIKEETIHQEEYYILADTSYFNFFLLHLKLKKLEKLHEKKLEELKLTLGVKNLPKDLRKNMNHDFVEKCLNVMQENEFKNFEMNDNISMKFKYQIQKILDELHYENIYKLLSFPFCIFLSNDLSSGIFPNFNAIVVSQKECPMDMNYKNLIVGRLTALVLSQTFDVDYANEKAPKLALDELRDEFGKKVANYFLNSVGMN